MFENMKREIQSKDVRYNYLIKVNSFLKNVNSPEIKKELKKQENILNTYKNETKRFKDISDFLVKKAKKDQENLIFRNGESHRIKTEINRLLDDKKTNDEKFSDDFGKHMW